MHDTGKVLLGLAVFAGLVTAPAWYALGRKGQPPELNVEDHTALLKLARGTLDEYLSQRTRPVYEPSSAAQQQPRATFVTLRDKHTHDLRGCRGEVFARYPLWESVQRVSILSATDDPRFKPMTHDELADMHIEISVLTPMRLARSPEEVIVGKHGVMIRKGGHGGARAAVLHRDLDPLQVAGLGARRAGAGGNGADRVRGKWDFHPPCGPLP